MTRHHIRYSIAAAIAALGVSIWIVSPLIAERFTIAADRSFPLVLGQHANVSFRPKLSGKHFIGVSCERNLPYSRLQQIIAPVFGEPTSRPKINFRLESGGKPVSTEPSNAAWWGRTVGFELGSFTATSGESYSLDADVLSAEADLRKLNGRLVVEVHPLVGESFYIRILFARLVGVILVVAACAVGLIEFLIRRAAKKR